MEKNEAQVNLLSRIVRKSMENPRAIAQRTIAFLRGCLYVAYYRIVKPKVRIALPLFVYDRMEIVGSGSVIIGSNCTIYKNTFCGLRIVTLSGDAQVHIGSNCAIGGLTIRCRRRVEIGEGTITAYSLVQDTLFIEQEKVKSRCDVNDPTMTGSVWIGKNVWLGGQAIILDSTLIADDSVISWGSVCRRMEIKEYSLAYGNPSMRPHSIPKIEQFQR
jgi:acetyltransferase-like isoleucine patch superfamily enzyme